MADFPINVKVDPGDSKTKIDGVHDTVAKAEKRADAATKAFKTLGDAIKYSANVTVSQAVRGFGSLTDAIQLEHKWITTIRGDLQGYAKDVAALDAMHRRGAISAKEHADAVARARSSAGIPTAKQGGGLLDSVAGQALAIAGPAALAAKAISSITSGLEEMRAKAQETREVNASMLRYQDTLEGARGTTERMRRVSDLLGQDLRVVGGAFLDIAGAASSLNLSEDKLVDITRSLGSIMKIEGKSISDVSGVMQTLEFAISKGTISSGELARMMKQFPPLAAIWREEFGGTTKQLLEAADNGQLAKLGLDRLLTSIRTTPEVVDKMKKSWQAQNQVIDTSSGYYKQLNSLMELNKLKATGVTDANRKLIDSWDTTVDSGNMLARGFDLLTSKADEFWNALQRLSKDPWGDDRNSLAKGIDQVTSMLGHAFDEGKKYVDKWKKSVAEARKEIDDLAKSFAKMQRTAPKAMLGSELGGMDAYRRYVDAEVERMSQPSDGDQSDFLAGDLQRLNDTEAAWKRMRTEVAKYKAELASQQDGIARGFNKLDAEFRDTATLTENMIVNAGHNMEDALVDAFRTGELSFSKMADSIIQDLTRIAIRKAAIGLVDMFGSSGLDFKASAGADRRVGYAAGGTVRGGGGATDTVPVSFFATQGERVIVQTQGQQMAAREAAQRSSSPQQAPQPATFVLDPRALLKILDSPMGARVIDDMQRRYPHLRGGG